MAVFSHCRQAVSSHDDVLLQVLLVQLAVEAVRPVLAELPLLVLLPGVLPLPRPFPLTEVGGVIPVRKLGTVILLLVDFNRGLDT